MVLRTLLVLVLLAPAAGCLHRPQASRVPEKTVVALAFVMDGDRDGALSDVPPALRRRVARELVARNLEPRELAFDGYAPVFRPVKDTQRRLSKLTNGEAPLVVLVETKAVFFSLLNGRYRWMVYAKLSVARKEGPPLTWDMDQAAFVDFEHQREADALGVVADAIADRVGALLDNYLGGAEAQGPAALSPRARGLYFVMVDRFQNGDPANDSTTDGKDPQAFHGGDLQGVLDRLDDLEELGVGTVWLSPIFQTRTEPFFGHGAFHGYWVEDFERVEPRFGDEALLRRLSDALRARGMRLVLDVVLNHVAMDAPLARQRPDWFHRRGPLEDWSDPVQLVDHDVHGLPDLAQENPEVWAHLLGASLRWVERARPDGFRLDAVKHVPLEFWARYNEALRERAGPGFLLLGEMLDGDAAVLARTQRTGRFGAMFDFPLYYALNDVFCRDQPPLRLGAALSSDRLYDDPDSLVTLLDNHDLPRVATACGGDLDRVRRALTVQLTARGTPGITYGTEAGLAGAGEPENRGDMVFDPQPLREHLTRLLRLRRAHPAIWDGASRILAADEGTFAYARVGPAEAAVVAVNQTLGPWRLELPAQLRGSMRDGLTGRLLPGPDLVVPPREVLVALITPPAPSGFAEAARAAREQWRSGSRTRKVQIAARGLPLCGGGSAFLVGSGPEMGAWNAARGLGPLDAAGRATVSLPVEAVFEFKLVVLRPDLSPRWEAGQNRSLYVAAGEGPLPLELAWSG